MSLKHKGASRLFAVVALATVSLTAVAEAQPNDRGRDGVPPHDDGSRHDGPARIRALVQPSRSRVRRMATRSSGTDGEADGRAARQA